MAVKNCRVAELQLGLGGLKNLPKLERCIELKKNIIATDEITSPALMWRRLADVEPSASAAADASYILEFIEQKKVLNGFIVPDRRKPDLLTFDRAPNKYFYWHLRADPLFRSFFINKLISVFSKGGDKKRIRNIFYELFEAEEDYFSPDVLYYIINSLRPKYLNVVARRGRDIYKAPILATDTKSVMKGIRFFKKAVMARTFENTLIEKIQGEILEYLF